jgi:hypothetical protein
MMFLTAAVSGGIRNSICERSAKARGEACIAAGSIDFLKKGCMF